MNFRVAHCIASKKSRFSHFFLWTFENCHLVCQPHKTIGKIQQTSESLNRAFELQLELHLHQNNLFFRFENSLLKSDALIFRRSVYETHLADSTLDDNTMYRFVAAHLVALQGLSAAYRDFYYTVLVHLFALPGLSRRLLLLK